MHEQERNMNPGESVENNPIIVKKASTELAEVLAYKADPQIDITFQFIGETAEYRGDFFGYEFEGTDHTISKYTQESDDYIGGFPTGILALDVNEWGTAAYDGVLLVPVSADSSNLEDFGKYYWYKQDKEVISASEVQPLLERVRRVVPQLPESDEWVVLRSVPKTEEDMPKPEPKEDHSLLKVRSVYYGSHEEYDEGDRISWFAVPNESMADFIYEARIWYRDGGYDPDLLDVSELLNTYLDLSHGHFSSHKEGLDRLPKDSVVWNEYSDQWSEVS